MVQINEKTKKERRVRVREISNEDATYTRVYHGTDSHAAQLIIRSQKFLPSRGGLLGKGVYLSRSRRKVQGYRVHHPNGKNTVNERLPNGQNDIGCVLQARVRLGYCKIMRRTDPREDFKTWSTEPVYGPG